MGRMFTNTHPAITLAIKSATVAQAQSEDKTFPFYNQHRPGQTALSTYYCKICYLRTLADKKQRTKAVTGWLRLAVLIIEMGGQGAFVVIYFLMNLLVLVM